MKKPKIRITAMLMAFMSAFVFASEAGYACVNRKIDQYIIA